MHHSHVNSPVFKIRQHVKTMTAKRNVVILYVCTTNTTRQDQIARLFFKNFSDCSTSRTASPASNRTTAVPVQMSLRNATITCKN